MTDIAATTTTEYGSAAKWLHWTMAAAILLNVPMGVAMVNVASGPLQDRLYNLHRSIGVLVLALAVVRLAVRLRGAPPPHPTLAEWQRRASGASHHTLYVLIFLMPLLGWAGTSAYGAPIIVFGLFELPPILAQNEATSKVLLALHRYVGIFMVIVVAVHVGGALMHGIILRDGVMSRMLPRLLQPKR